MKKINMVDLKSQYEKIKEEIDGRIAGVINSTAFINGPEVQNFQKELGDYLNVKHVIGCANGTDALQISMMALGLKAGDEVLTVPFTFVATVEVIALLGLKPVFVDVEADTFNIDVSRLDQFITPKTKAIIPVHLFGQSCNMEALMNFAKEKGLYVIEDNCQAIGSSFKFSNGDVKKAGSIGDIGCTSFFPSKNLGCYGDGGAIFTNNDELATIIRSVVNHGMTVRYYHDHIGVNSRLDSIQAAILSVKLKHLDNYIKARQAAASFYDNAFKNIEELSTPARYAQSTHVFHQYTLKLRNVDRAKLIEHLNSKDIPAMIYYPVPLHLQKAYIGFGNYKKGDFPVTEALCEQVFSLPMHTELEEEQLDYITRSVVEFIKKS